MTENRIINVKSIAITGVIALIGLVAKGFYTYYSDQAAQKIYTDTQVEKVELNVQKPLERVLMYQMKLTEDVSKIKGKMDID